MANLSNFIILSSFWFEKTLCQFNRLEKRKCLFGASSWAHAPHKACVATNFGNADGADNGQGYVFY